MGAGCTSTTLRIGKIPGRQSNTLQNNSSTIDDQCICVTGRVYSWTASLARLSFQDLAPQLHNCEVVHNNGATVFGRRPSSLSGAAVPEKRHGKIRGKTLVTRKSSQLRITRSPFRRWRKVIAWQQSSLEIALIWDAYWDTLLRTDIAGCFCSMTARRSVACRSSLNQHSTREVTE